MRMGIAGSLRTFSILVVALMLVVPSIVIIPTTAAPAYDQKATLPSESSGTYIQNVSIYENFTRTSLLGSYPNKIVQGDFNHDGKMDLAVTYFGKTKVDIFLQNAAGNYSDTPFKTITGIGVPTTMGVGDLDNDGWDDLVVCWNNLGSGYALILYQSQNFAVDIANNRVQTSKNPDAIVIGKFDGDGTYDFAISSSDPGPPNKSIIEFHFNTSGFAIYSSNIALTPKEMFMLVAADIDNDGDDDLVVANETITSGNVLYVFVNADPIGFSWTGSPLPIIGPVGLSFAKITSSAYPSLIIADRGGNKVWIYTWSGSQMTETLDITGISGLRMAKGADMNGDGLSDVVLLSDTANRFSRYTNNGGSSLTFVGTTPCMERAVSLLPYDNGDGREGVITAHNLSASNGAVCIYDNVAGNIDNANLNIWSDQRMDQVFWGNFSTIGSAFGYLNWTTHMLYLYESGTWHTITVPAGCTKLTTLSLSDPRYDDLILIDPSANRIYVYLHGTTFNSRSEPSYWLSTSNSPISLGSGDVNGDGSVDLLVGYLGGLTFFNNTNTGNRLSNGTKYTFSIPNARPTWIMVGDFNVYNEGLGPKKNDVAIVNSSVANRIEIFRQSSQFSIANSVNLTNPGSTILWGASSYLDVDGLIDITIGTADGRLMLYPQDDNLNSGFSDSTVQTLSCTYGFSGAVLEDVDDDGDDEVLLTGSETHTLSLVQVDGTGFHQQYYQTGGAGSILASGADINGDNRTDMVIASPGSKSVSVYYQRNLPPKALIVPNATQPLEGTVVTFDGSPSTDQKSDVDLLTYQWSVRYQGTSTWVPAGQFTSVPTATYEFNADGTHLIRLIVTDRGGLSNTSFSTMTVLDAGPNAYFAIPSGTLLENTTIHFVDGSYSYPDTIQTWSWDFDDGTPVDHSQNPYHVFIQNGTYNVTLTITDEDGSQDSTYQIINIIDQGPTALFTASAWSIAEGNSITFTSTSSSPADTITEYNWAIENDTYQGTGKSITYQFTRNGLFWVNLTVIENDLDTATYFRTVLITDTYPEVYISVDWTNSTTGELVYEGTQVNFHDTSPTPYDGLSSRYWTFGDGGTATEKDPQHIYRNQGTYTVVLWLMDSDGSNRSAVYVIDVLDTEPTVRALTASGTGTGEPNSYAKRTDITFQVDLTKMYDPLTYHWWINSSSATVFEITTSVPTLIYAIDDAGTYMVTVRISDYDDIYYREININVKDVSLPIARFNFEIDIASMTVFFSANESYDPDLDNLTYIWNFGDGSDWTTSSTARTISHHYTYEDVFTVTLRVTDESGQTNEISHSIIIDLTKPEVIIKDPTTSSYVDEPIQINVEVHDAIGYNVTLLYSYDGVNYTEVPMIAVDALGNFTYQIPALNATGKVWFKVRAVDENNNERLTEASEIQIVERPDLTYVYLGIGALLAALLVLLLFFWRTKPVVDEVFVIYHDGNLIAHQTRRLKPGMDDQIMGSMLVALQNFVKDSFKDETDTVLKRMDFGEQTIMVERGDFIFIAAVVRGSRTGSVPGRLQKVLDNIDDKYAIELIDWEGDLDKLRGVRDETNLVFERESFFPKKERKG